MTIDEFPLPMQIVIVLFVLLFFIETIAGYLYTSKENIRARKIARLVRWPVTILMIIFIGYQIYEQEWVFSLLLSVLLAGRVYWDRKFLK